MAQDSARLQHFQTVVTLASELDLASLHPPMASSSPTPLCSVSGWDSERLKRVSRWRPSDDPGKYLVRAYCKVVLALDELDSCSQRISLHSRAAASPAAPIIQLSPPQSASSGVVLTSAVKSLRKQTSEVGTSGRAKAPSKSQWVTRKIGNFQLPSPPACLCDILCAWTTALQYMASFFVFCLTWAPWFGLAAGGILILAEPSLLLKLLFRMVGFVPSVVREYVRYLSEPAVVEFHRPGFASGTSSYLPIPQPVSPQPDPALIGHCTIPVEDRSAWWLAAGQGGVVSVYVLAKWFRWLLP